MAWGISFFGGIPLFYGSFISKHNLGGIRRDEKTPTTECKNKSYHFTFRSILSTCLLSIGYQYMPFCIAKRSVLGRQTVRFAS